MPAARASGRTSAARGDFRAHGRRRTGHRRHDGRPRPAHRQRGAAIVLALLVMTLGVLLVSGAFLRQDVLAREVENEAGAAQARWLLTGAIDWVRVILREDARTSSVDHAGEPWAAPLAHTRIGLGDDAAAWLDGRIEDAQARYNLRNLSGAAGLVADEIAVLARLLAFVGADANLADPLARRIDAALSMQRDRGIPLLPATLDELALADANDRALLARLRPFVTLLPVPTPVNANTASAEVLAARIAGLPLIDARQLVAARDRAWFRDTSDLRQRLPGLPIPDASRLGTGARFFLVHGTVESGRAQRAAMALLRRDAGRVDVLWVRDHGSTGS